MISWASKSVTLIELLISIVLIGLVILGLSNIELFCRNQLISSDRRLKVQNDASFLLEHMAKYIGRAIGDAQNYPVDFDGVNTTRAIIDRNNNGLKDLEEEQYQIAYEYNQAAHTVSFCSSYDNTTNQCRDTSGPVSWEILANHILTNILPPNLDIHGGNSNYITVNITACWDPNRTCGTIDNPETTMCSTITMPSLSVR
jgi:Tfp pilus assembly protein PilV